MDLGTVATPAAALVAGAITSLHCIGMCGPITCALAAAGGPGSQKAGFLSFAPYHVARLFSYTLVGAALGLLGQPVAAMFGAGPGRVAPWALAAVFLLIGLGLDKKIPQPRFLAPLLFRLRLGEMPLVKSGGLLGCATPLLPCGPLYLVFGAALLAGSALAGARLMAAFALGTMVLFWPAQSQLFRLRAAMPPAAWAWTRQGVALLSAGLLVWRAVVGGGIGSGACPMCH